MRNKKAVGTGKIKAGLYKEFSKSKVLFKKMRIGILYHEDGGNSGQL